MSRIYDIEIEREGRSILAGHITGGDEGGGTFRYAQTYLSDPQAVPVSVSLPLREEPFSERETKIYFDGLLPEGFTRRAVSRWAHVDGDSYLPLLHVLGRECLGAVSVRLAGEKPARAEYEPLTIGQVKALAAEGAEKSAELVTRAHLSLTGASGKVGLYFDEKKNAWYLPKGTAPSTHIVKQSHVRLSSIVTNEQLCLLTARKCQIRTAESFIINTGEASDQEVLLASRRYDRVTEGASRRVGGLRRPLRLHQEDFAQALGIPSEAKYEQEKRGYLSSMFGLISRCSANPIQDRMQLWDSVVFDYLIGNTDSHLKNHSLLYDAKLRYMRLAPAYDMISTTVYPSGSLDMAFFIGDDCRLDRIDEKSFEKAAREAGIGPGMAKNRFEKMLESFQPALEEAAGELTAGGFSKAQEIKEKILKTGGIKKYA